MLHVNQAMPDDNVDSICKLYWFMEILERCENSRCVPKYKSPSRLSQKRQRLKTVSSLMPMILAIKRRHSLYSWESEITLVEKARNCSGLRGLAPRNSEFEHSSNSPFLLTIKMIAYCL